LLCEVANRQSVRQKERQMPGKTQPPWRR